MARQKVIILLNSGGTGTHLVQSLFFKHGEIVSAELANYWGAAALYLTKPDEVHHWPDRDENFKNKNNRDYFLDICDRYGGNAAERSTGAGELIRNTWDRLVAGHSGIVFDKSMTYMAYHNDWGRDEIAATHKLLIEYYRDPRDHDVRFIILVREPLDHIASLFERRVFSMVQNTSIPGFEAMDYPRKLRELVIQYHRNIDSFVSSLRDDDYLLVKYEDICLGPNRTVRAMFDYLGLPPPRGIDDFTHEYSVSKWLDTGEARQFAGDAEIKKIQRKYDYRVPPPSLIGRLAASLRRRVNDLRLIRRQQRGQFSGTIRDLDDSALVKHALKYGRKSPINLLLYILVVIFDTLSQLVSRARRESPS
jgi:hypothetical protein